MTDKIGTFVEEVVRPLMDSGTDPRREEMKTVKVAAAVPVEFVLFQF